VLDSGTSLSVLVTQILLCFEHCFPNWFILIFPLCKNSSDKFKASSSVRDLVFSLQL
jgi:hypothetical protein